ncbi:uncharacterized protein KY384_006835 [Bacidia gigantensis]|uniref:uncharacterized protein n=1 Tax=Bacidia gigantensis TaxID=2732470 RepID=UPI001D03A53F|nr:uncharacterized protein KY384_006835 [Bacidia gigantensis]KAG8527919.1 hypothetical protein KY384_006835 [Bacidia gigantensis]
MSPDAPSPSAKSLKPQRLLACLLCTQRKVKFPERELLERVRRYEDLLRRNNIAFEPLHRDTAGDKEPSAADSGQDSDLEHKETSKPDQASLLAPGKIIGNYDVKYVLLKNFRDPNNDGDSSDDDIREIAIKKAWERSLDSDDLLLFGSSRMTTSLSSLHPEPAQIFRLWQIYLDNVDPLLKVTHTPSLQGRLVEAASKVSDISPTTEALMFSIYCTSIGSLTVEACQAMFSTPKDDLLMRYQSGCRQALSNCSFLRSSDRDSLTALYMYLISVRPSTSPQSLSAVLGIAIRIAQRMGIHMESALAKCAVVEAEMRRRLWWSLVLFDTRIGEIANSRPIMLDPTWDCKTPLNVNDTDLRPEMKGSPAAQRSPTEALFAVVRGKLGDFVRHSEFHLDFTNPALKPIVQHLQNRSAPEDTQLAKFEQLIEDQYLKYCDQDNPIHFMTTWSTRAFLAKFRLLEHHARHSRSKVRQTETQHDAATSYALRMLECATKIMTSPLTTRFQWMNQSHFPFPAFIQIVQDLRRRPVSNQARQAWETMSEAYEAWFDPQYRPTSPFFQIFSKIVLQAWEASEAASKCLGATLLPPRIISLIRLTLEQAAARDVRFANVEQTNVSMAMGGTKSRRLC